MCITRRKVAHIGGGEGKRVFKKGEKSVYKVWFIDKRGIEQKKKQGVDTR